MVSTCILLSVLGVESIDDMTVCCDDDAAMYGKHPHNIYTVIMLINQMWSQI